MSKNISYKKKRQSFVQGFKDFISRGSVIDLAVGVIIGGAFGKIVTSLVNDIITPPISLLFKGSELKDAKWILRPEIVANEVITQTEVALRYGSFIMLIFEFLIIAFSIYAVLTLIIRRKQFMDKLKAEELAKKELKTESKEKVITEDIKLLTEIRDLLKEQEA